MTIPVEHQLLQLKKEMEALQLKYESAHQMLMDCFKSNVDLVATLRARDKHISDLITNAASDVVKKQGIIDELNKRNVEIMEKLKAATSG